MPWTQFLQASFPDRFDQNHFTRGPSNNILKGKKDVQKFFFIKLRSNLEAKGQLYHVGAHFEALCLGVLMAVSDFSCNFFVS